MPSLLQVYGQLVGLILAGWVLGRYLPASTPRLLGKCLYWFGVPISILAFLRHAQVSLSLWIAPVIAWAAILIGIGLSWLIVRRRDISDRTKGSFLLSSMVGNTGYIGYPVTLALVGPQHFAWALFYDIGSTFGAYGLGTALATHFGENRSTLWQSLQTVLKNPALWSFAISMLLRNFPLPTAIETGLKTFAWGVISLSLVLIGMRLSQLTCFQRLKPAALSLGIKMILVPLVLGLVLKEMGLVNPIHRVMLLQMAMPPAFATLVLAETYELDQELTVTTLVLGCLCLLVMLPLWLWLFN
ncbi:MAG: AEC family transporter [Leptolyngbyaceae cyanobacterium]